MITLKNVVLRRGAKVILDNASIALNPGEKIGLVGRNGAGKSSLFAMLNGTLHEDGGEYYIPAQWKMAQVAQDMPETEQSATSYVIEGDVVLLAAQAEVDAAEISGDGDRMAHAYMDLYDSGAHDAQARAQALILGLGFKLSELDNPVNSFSGGWRMRLQLARALAPIQGEMTEGKGLNIGYFAQQELDVLRLADNPLEHMIRLVKEVSAAGKLGNQPTREQDLRSFLGNFNFGGDMVKQAVGSMSGGEKARLVLCMIVWQRPNLLLLDEPTNHLDLATREALSMALNEFEGTVMLVSHDRALLRAVCDEFWMVSRGGVAPFDGDLDDYQRYLLDEAKRLREEAKKSTNSPAATKTVAASANTVSTKPISDVKNSSDKKEDAQKRQQQSEAAKPLRKELEKIDRQLQSLNTEKANLGILLTTSKSPAEIAQAGKRLKVIEADLGKLEERWLEVTEKIEAVAV